MAREDELVAEDELIETQADDEDTTMTDLMIIIGLTLASLPRGRIGRLGLLHLVRYRSLRQQLTIATLLPVVAVAATVLINVQLMFLSAHDSVVILIALLVSLLLAASAHGWWCGGSPAPHVDWAPDCHQLVSDSSSGSRVAAAEMKEDAAPRELAQVLQDLAETRRTLAESRARARAAERSRQELVSFMSHDLRTPLAGLRALSEGLEDGVIADVPRAMSHAPSHGGSDERPGRRSVRIVPRPGAPRAKPQTMVSLTELISDVASESTVSARTQGVRLEVDLPDDDRLAVLGSSDDLARALSESDHQRDPPHRSRARGDGSRAGRADDGHVRVAVVDGCGGIPEASLARVFDAGWRGTPSRSGDDGGAGLGLAIARGVVDSHDGEISVRNVQGGCRFEVSLPAPSRRITSHDEPCLPAAPDSSVGRFMINSRRAGHDVRAFDRAVDERDDVLDHDRLRPAADGCEAVIHLAAKVGLGVDITDIDEYALQNDVGTAMTLRVAAEQDSRFVYASSMVVYGEGRYRCVRHGSMSPPPRDRNDLDAAALRPAVPLLR